MKTNRQVITKLLKRLFRTNPTDMSCAIGEVAWTGRVRIAKCGGTDDRFCGQEYQFREAHTGLGTKRWETICPVCDLKWAVMATNIYSERLKLCQELGQLLNVDERSAYLIAARSFKPTKGTDNGFTYLPVIKAPEQIRIPDKPAALPYRMPYTEH